MSAAAYVAYAIATFIVFVFAPVSLYIGACLKKRSVKRKKARKQLIGV